MIKKAIQSLLYVVYPKRCELCGDVVRVEDRFCAECENAEMISGDVCEKCGREKTNCICKREKYSPEYKAFTAPYYYEDFAQRGIRRFKNYSFTELAPAMSERICESINERFKGITFDCVTSVPLTKRKQKQRGYNQSEILAKETARLLGCEYKALLVKTRKTPSQRYSSAKDRRVNLYGAFDMAENADVSGKTVLIVDDVKTTGSTLNECSAVLKGNKTAAVYAASFAVTNSKK